MFVNVVCCQHHHHPQHRFIDAIRKNTQTNKRYFWTRLSIMYKFSVESYHFVVRSVFIRWWKCAVWMRVRTNYTFVQASHAMYYTSIVHVSEPSVAIAVAVVAIALPPLLLFLPSLSSHCYFYCVFFSLWMFYQHGKWVEKTGESPPRVWRSMHTGYTHLHTNKHQNTIFVFTSLFHSLFVSYFFRPFSRAALRCTVCAEQSSCYSHIWDRQKANNNTFIWCRLSQSAIIHLSLSLSLSLTRRSCVCVCTRLSLFRSTLYSWRCHTHICVYVFFFRFFSF